ncbi:hypothetical protein CPB84DRAFT_1750935 [Gymnopilus junonius]|uniref:Uncharacterized protein n=1 Tax=Gymnopilus junonius TaxID=109634 RepID=A0A9P5NCN6_GYMJU|nr:hypothetical protein CPB84DRAFT_1750935 [Gymnopilus junonius]
MVLVIRETDTVVETGPTYEWKGCVHPTACSGTTGTTSVATPGPLIVSFRFNPFIDSPFSQSRYCSDSRVSFVCSFLDELGLAGCRFVWYLIMCYCVVGVRRAGGEWMRLSSEEACTTGMDGPAEIGPRKFIRGNKLVHP